MEARIGSLHVMCLLELKSHSTEVEGQLDQRDLLDGNFKQARRLSMSSQTAR